MDATTRNLQEKLKRLQEIRLYECGDLRLEICERSMTYIFPIKDILRMEADGSYTTLHLSNGRSHTASGHLGKYENRIPPGYFARMHDKWSVNLRHVYGYDNNGHIYFSDGKSLKTSYRCKKDFMEAIKAFGFQFHPSTPTLIN